MTTFSVQVDNDRGLVMKKAISEEEILDIRRDQLLKFVEHIMQVFDQRELSHVVKFVGEKLYGDHAG